jgi:hypothetical protein
MLERIASWSVFDVDTSLIEDGTRDLISFFLKKLQKRMDRGSFQILILILTAVMMSPHMLRSMSV